MRNSGATLAAAIAAFRRRGFRGLTVSYLECDTTCQLRGITASLHKNTHSLGLRGFNPKTESIMAAKSIAGGLDVLRMLSLIAAIKFWRR